MKVLNSASTFGYDFLHLEFKAFQPCTKLFKYEKSLQFLNHNIIISSLVTRSLFTFFYTKVKMLNEYLDAFYISKFFFVRMHLGFRKE